jgi:hypothetical protein
MVFVDSRHSLGDETGSILYESHGGAELDPHARFFVIEFTCVAAWATIDESNTYQWVTNGML